MKNLLTKFAFAILVLLTSIILGLFVPVIFSLLISITTLATFTECVQTFPFWVFTIIGLFTSFCYINEVIKEI